MDNKENSVVIYQDDNGATKVSVRFADEDLWLTQPQIAELYDTTQQNISQHIDSIYKDGELDKEATNKKFLLVRTEGTRQVKRDLDHYNLDMIIALGYRIQSKIATRFRRWATIRLHEYIQKATEYLVVENRALWEFELDLSDDEKSLLKQRVWDLKGRQDKYSFMSYNCNSAIEWLLSGVNLGFMMLVFSQFLRISNLWFLKNLRKKKQMILNFHVFSLNGTIRKSDCQIGLFQIGIT